MWKTLIKFTPLYVCKSILNRPTYLQGILPLFGVFDFFQNKKIIKELLPLLGLVLVGVFLSLFNMSTTSFVRCGQMFFLIFSVSFFIRHYSVNDFLKLSRVIIILGIIILIFYHILRMNYVFNIGDKILIPGIFSFSIPFTPGLVGEPNYSGVLYAGLSLIFLSQKKYLFYILSTALVFMTVSRSALVITILSFLLLLLPYISKKIINVVGFSILLFFISYPVIVYFSQFILSIELQQTLDKLSSGRYGIHLTYVEMFKDFPLGRGYFLGVEDFLKYFHAETSTFNQYLNHYKSPFEQHSTFLQVFVEFGIIGYGLFCYFLFRFYNYLKSSGTELSYSFVCLCGGLLQLNGLNEFIFYFFIAFALVVCKEKYNIKNTEIDFKNIGRNYVRSL